MKIDILTIFPDFFRGPLDYGIVRRARETGLVEINIHDLRAFTKDKHRTVDDRPFGGGEGMVLKPEPIFECLESFGDVVPREARLAPGSKQSVILLSAQGGRLDQTLAAELSGLDRIVLICGRYEGVDERISEHLADREVSIGDYVLSGGELGAAVIVDTVTRLIPDAPGVVHRVVDYGKGETCRRCSQFDLRFGRIARLSALHASRGFSRHGSAGSAGEREPRRDSQLAPQNSFGKNAAQPS